VVAKRHGGFSPLPILKVKPLQDQDLGKAESPQVGQWL